MNTFQRWCIRLAARLAPPLQRVLTSAGGTIEALEVQNAVLQDRLDDKRELIQREMQDCREAIALAGGGWTSKRSREAAPAAGDSMGVIQLKERLAELELALEDRGWKRQLAYAESEFSRYGIQQIILICRLYFVKNPLIQRGIKVSSYYVFGRGVEVSSPDEDANAVLQDFFTNPKNLPELSHKALVTKEESRHTDGNLFFIFFVDPADGGTLLRTIDPLEVQEIITDPNDMGVPWYYHRMWTWQEFDVKTGIYIPHQQEAYYVDINYEPPAGLKFIKDKPVVIDPVTGDYVRVLHDKSGSLPKWHFGCPVVYAALDWARAYRHFLEDWATITRALARFSWSIETKGGIPAIAAFKQTLATTLANNETNVEQNPPPVTGSAWITGPGNKLTPVKTSGATTEPEQGRRVLLMVCAAFGLPETFFGDASTGSLATAVSLDRPTELKFMETQERWRELLQRISLYVLDQSERSPNGKLREARKKKPAKEPVKVEVKFPSVLEHDINARVNAIVEAMTLNGFQPGTGIDEQIGVGLLLSELGVEDVEAVLETMYPEGKGHDYDPDRTKEPEPAVPGAGGPETIEPAGGAPPVKPHPRNPHPKRVQPQEAVVAKAVGELRRALQSLKERKLIGTTNGH